MAPRRQNRPQPEEAPLGLAALYDAHAGRVAGWAARLAGPSLDAEDIVHEVFLAAGQRLAEFRGEARVTTWLYRITANVVRDRRRKEQRLWRRNRAGGAAQHGAPRPTPVEELERRQATELVYRVLDEMKEEERTLLILFEIEALPGEEIAELLDLRVETVWVRLHRARARFRERLERLFPEECDTLRGRR
jgi:RNA polymerase sigma-70 factor, ECF subfamily